ncbi:MAG TPA: glycosyltransferase family 2 protein [Actinomycetota bacterium]
MGDEMRPVLFSIVIPTYGRPQYLAEAVASVAAQTIDDFECVIVDDASPEPVGVIADRRFRVVRRPRNGGAPAARNTGLAAARGQYVTFLDDDDRYAPERLEFGLRGVSQAPIGVCWSDSLDRGGRPSGRTLQGDVGDTILDGLVPHLGCTTVRRDVALPFDEGLRAQDDVEWWLRMARIARVATVPEVGYLFRYHEGTRHGRPFAVRLGCTIEILERHADYFARHPAAAAFRWKTVGHHSSQLGDHRLARRAFARSLRFQPSARTAWSMVRSLRRTRATLAGEGQLPA